MERQLARAIVRIQIKKMVDAEQRMNHAFVEYEKMKAEFVTIKDSQVYIEDVFQKADYSKDYSEMLNAF